MRHFLVFFQLILFIQFSSAQIGFKTVSTFPQNRISEKNTNNKLFPVLFGAGADYWFRLKKYRLEILPSIHYQYAHENVTLTNNALGTLNWSMIDISPVFQFYPLDFFSDCQCPTFSKQGQFLKKGLFVQLAPGYAYSNLVGKNTETSNVSEGIGFVRAGAGIDIGISDLITISPFINYQLAQSLDWRDFFNNATEKVNVYSGVFGGLRIGWRFDRRNY